MKPLRIGIILLVIGATLLFATNLRAATKSISDNVKGHSALGPFLLEPRETTLVLRDVSPKNDTFTVSLVNGQNWEAPVFSVGEMQRLSSVTFRLNTRGLYYVVVTGSAGELAEQVQTTVEQRGIAEDLLAISLIATIIGASIITTDQLRPFIRSKPEMRKE